MVVTAMGAGVDRSIAPLTPSVPIAKVCQCSRYKVWLPVSQICETGMQVTCAPGVNSVKL